jgi:hypothetical protein
MIGNDPALRVERERIRSVGVFEKSRDTETLVPAATTPAIAGATVSVAGGTGACGAPWINAVTPEKASAASSLILGRRIRNVSISVKV